MKEIRIGVLVSGNGTNLQAVMSACDLEIINGKVVVVGSDNADAYGLERAKGKNIPTFDIPYAEIIKNNFNLSDIPQDFDLKAALEKFDQILLKVNYDKTVDFLTSRAIAEKKLLDALAPYELDLLVLAGFRRKLTPYFLDRFSPNPHEPKVMNIHPALLPSFPGTRGYEATWEYGCRVYGCTVHFVDYGEDTGPIIWQQALTRLSDDDFETYKQRGLKTEWKVFPFCIMLFAEGRLRVRQNEAGRKVVDLLGYKDIPGLIIE